MRLFYVLIEVKLSEECDNLVKFVFINGGIGLQLFCGAYGSAVDNYFYPAAHLIDGYQSAALE